MYKLTIVAGPNRGSSFPVKEGENLIGRNSAAQVFLNSARISKRHCVIVFEHGQIVLRDVGSANGTFVNGVLSSFRTLQVGDRISVGDYVLQLRKSSRHKKQAPPAARSIGGSPQNLISLSQVQGQAASANRNLPAMADQFQVSGNLALQQDYYGEAQAHSVNSSVADPSASGIPQDLPGKIKWGFEQKFMPFFYNLLMKHEWRWVGAGLLGFFLVANLLVTIQPLVLQSQKAVLTESAKRARVMARQISALNGPLLAKGTKTDLTIGSAKEEVGVRYAALLDLENRYLAPAENTGSYLTTDDEAALAVKLARAFREGRTEGFTGILGSSTVIAIEPVMTFNPRLAKNVVSAMALVSLDASLSLPSTSQLALMYSETLILSGLMGLLILLILYRLTLKPFEVLNEDIDKVLKGDLNEITQEYKVEELTPLWDVVRSALHRVPRSGPGEDGLGGGETGSLSIEDFLPALRAVGETAGFGMIVIDADRHVSFMNSSFEDMSGIHPGEAYGQDISAVSRDDAFTALCDDFFERALPGAEPVVDEFEFSGVNYKVTAVALGNFSSGAVGYVITAKKAEE